FAIRIIHGAVKAGIQAFYRIGRGIVHARPNIPIDHPAVFIGRLGFPDAGLRDLYVPTRVSTVNLHHVDAVIGPAGDENVIPGVVGEAQIRPFVGGQPVWLENRGVEARTPTIAFVTGEAIG